MRSPRTAMKSSPRSTQLEKAHAQQWRPNAAKNKQINLKKINNVTCFPLLFKNVCGIIKIHIWSLHPVLGKEFLKLLEFPECQECLLLFITSPFQTYLSLCSWGHGLGRGGCWWAEEPVIRRWKLLVPPTPSLSGREKELEIEFNHWRPMIQSIVSM